MSTFNPHEGGTPATAWDGLLAGLPQLPMPGGGARLVVLAAHPDDETLGCGGLLATDGEASHPHSRTHRPPQLAAALEESVRGCSHLVTPWAADGHADHDACGQLGAEVAARFDLRHWPHPIWAWHWSDPCRADLPMHRLRTVALSAPAQQAKAAALRCYASQHQPLSAHPGDEVLLGPHVLAHSARAFETFVAAHAADAATPTFSTTSTAPRRTRGGWPNGSMSNASARSSWRR